MNQAESKHEKMIAKRCIEQAKAMLGPGWGHISRELQWGLISANIINVLLAQDDSIDAAKVRDYILRVTFLAKRMFGQD